MGGKGRVAGRPQDLASRLCRELRPRPGRPLLPPPDDLLSARPSLVSSAPDPGLGLDVELVVDSLPDSARLRFLAARPFPLDLVFFLAFFLGSAFLMAAGLASSCSEIDGNQKHGNVSQF